MEDNYSPIIGPQYYLPCPINLAFTTKIAGVSHGELSVTDVNGNPLFYFGESSSEDNKWILVDAISSCTIVSMKRKYWSLHDRWQVFKGDTTKQEDSLFSVKRSSALQFHTKLKVFLAGNTDQEDKCDFMIKGSYRKKSTIIYKGDRASNIVLAQLSNKHEVIKCPLEKDAFGVNINPYTDYAFIATLIAILHKISQESEEAASQESEKAASQVIEEAASKVIEQAASKVIEQAASQVIEQAASQVIEQAASQVNEEKASQGIEGLFSILFS